MKFIFVESNKKNKNGHVSHLLKWAGGYYKEISLSTGRDLRYGLYFDDEDMIERYGYKILDVKKDRVTLVGYNTRFADRVIEYLEESE